MDRISIAAPRPHAATVDVPGDKSISHRALLLSAIAHGSSRIANLNLGADVQATADALRSLGVPVEQAAQQTLVITGVSELRDPSATLDCGNSGTTMRLLTGLIAGRVNAVLDGDASLRRRPMERVAAPLRTMGAEVATTQGKPPIRMRRSPSPLRGALFSMDHASAQVKSALLFAGLRAQGDTVVVEPEQTRDHTERMLRAMGAPIVVADREIHIKAGSLRALGDFEVPGDFSAAFFFIAGAAVLVGADVTIRNVGVNPTRIAALDIVRAMGVDVTLLSERSTYGEPVADIRVRGGAVLRGVDVPAALVPNLIDEIPALCALAAFAQGTFSVRSAAELRVKESDRIATTAGLLRSFGVAAEEAADGLIVQGGRTLSAPPSVQTHGDHRIGMSAAILAAGARVPLLIEDAACIATSFPEFERTWRLAFGPHMEW